MFKSSSNHLSRTFVLLLFRQVATCFDTDEMKPLEMAVFKRI